MNKNFDKFVFEDKQLFKFIFEEYIKMMTKDKKIALTDENKKCINFDQLSLDKQTSERKSS